MFCFCVILSDLNITSFNVSKVQEFCDFLRNCITLQTLDLSNFNINIRANTNQIFKGCKSLKRIELNGLDSDKLFKNKSSKIYASDILDYRRKVDALTPENKKLLEEFLNGRG
jgi:hypothetical protein